MKAKYSAFSAVKKMERETTTRHRHPSDDITVASFQKVIYLLVGLGLFAVLGPLAYNHLLSRTVPIAYGVMSALTMLLYFIDKYRAIHRLWRIPEAVLHLFELLGGWPGAMIIQVLLHHKNAKMAYQILFWIMAIANVVLLKVYVLR